MVINALGEENGVPFQLLAERLRGCLTSLKTG